jgi:hypothetical protein
MFVLDDIDRRLGNMSVMMERLGVESIDLCWQDKGLVLGSAIRACQTCPNGEMCRDWLERASSSLQTAPAFCPNAQRFTRAKESQLRNLLA